MSVSCRVSRRAQLCPLFCLLTGPSYPQSPLYVVLQYALRSHTRVATPRSARSKPRSTPMNLSPSSDTRIRRCFTRQTSGYSSGLMNGACWMRLTKALSSSRGTSWSACDGSRTGGMRWAQPEERRGQPISAEDDGCHNPLSLSSRRRGWWQARLVDILIRSDLLHSCDGFRWGVGCTCICVRVTYILA
jgi:hypothetical protein